MNEIFSYVIEIILFFSIFIFSYLYFHRLFYQNELAFYKLLTFFITCTISFDLKKYIDQKIPITPEAFRYILENDRENLLLQYQNLIPYNDSVQYHTLVPFHSNGLSKKVINYRDYFHPQNIIIKHFSSYIKEKGKHEDDRSLFVIDPRDEKLKENIQKNFTIIYAITVSNPTPHLLREIQALYHDEVAFIIFYDNKSNRTNLYNLFSTVVNNKKFENVYFVDSPRICIEWGQISLTFSELIMCAVSLKYFPNSLYLSTHSESDYPLVPNDIIISNLKRMYPNNYMEVIPPQREGHHKSGRKHAFQFFFDNKENNQIIKIIRHLFPKKIIPDAKWRSGANWFTLTMIDVAKMMNRLYERFELIDTLDYCLFSDEIIFTTLAAEVDVSNIKCYLRYISWRGVGRMPATFTEDRYDELVEPRCAFWSRKFRIEISVKVLDMIDNHIKNFPPTNFSKYC